jgi:hypothetical protein
MTNSVGSVSVVLDQQVSTSHIGAKDAPVYKSILFVVHGKDQSQLRGQHIFLQLSSKYLELPSIHAQLKHFHFHQAVEHSQVRVNAFCEQDVLPAKQINARKKHFMFGESYKYPYSDPSRKLFMRHKLLLQEDTEDQHKLRVDAGDPSFTLPCRSA